MNDFDAQYDRALVELYAAEQAADSQLTEAELQHKYAQIQALNNMLDFMAECMDNGPVRY